MKLGVPSRRGRSRHGQCPAGLDPYEIALSQAARRLGLRLRKARSIGGVDSYEVVEDGVTVAGPMEIDTVAEWLFWEETAIPYDHSHFTLH
jgi:hypothetical protein